MFSISRGITILTTLTWPRKHFDTIRADADDVTIQQHYGAYILDFFDRCIFADRSGAYVHLFFLQLLEDMEHVDEYAWGAAAFSWLYMELGCCAFRIESSPTRDHIGYIGGWMALVQAWALEIFPSIVRQVHHVLGPSHAQGCTGGCSRSTHAQVRACTLVFHV
ncbi:Serine/threonine-protein phosphatase 7 long form homolog [Linum perenne]